MLAPLAPEVITLGCRLNIAESETIRGFLGSRDVVVVNSCAVTNEAVKATRAAIRRARRRRPGAEIVVTGCAATIDPAGFAGMAEVDRIVGNPDKLAPGHWGAPDLPTTVRFEGHARALVEVQNGCDHRCTFCAIPFGRGPSRSVPAGAVVGRIAELVDAGHNEVVLTGVDLTSYGHDLPGSPTLGHLVERILKLVPGLPRLRLSSLDGIEIDDRLFDLLTAEARVMPHVHLSLQAGDDMILKRMKRRHTRAQSVALVGRLKAKRPEIAIGADIIAGFPTEDEAMFANSAALIADCDIVHAHVFPYSPRADTPAARMPQVAPPVVKDRAARLRAAAEAHRTRWLETLVGTEQRVLVEAPGDRGRAENFAEIRLAPTPFALSLSKGCPSSDEEQDRASTSSARTGDVVSATITRTADNELIGTFA
ncbi:2-methylthioadenine synthase [Sphingomonas sp. Leaf33]|uniref:MiaB/RimO family radical SAM methylthiotransferase n=1 Tax=Sphingomonas sp. Leaf33 TaxID=1736215 RepID=UPI0006FE18DC|nr:radical SAM protein [Sphingomonas sp. Leaf33]KQN25972.1 2-methylthioadenine synthase [Sphingomonas sp. Leaf33]